MKRFLIAIVAMITLATADFAAFASVEEIEEAFAGQNRVEKLTSVAALLNEGVATPENGVDAVKFDEKKNDIVFYMTMTDDEVLTANLYPDLFKKTFTESFAGDADSLDFFKFIGKNNAGVTLSITSKTNKKNKAEVTLSAHELLKMK